ncbi:DNA replication protein psf1 [Claviceps citrina]|nr:DNA replication protein psf1 [Claviceps citrina]
MAKRIHPFFGALPRRVGDEHMKQSVSGSMYVPKTRLIGVLCDNIRLDGRHIDCTATSTTDASSDVAASNVPYLSFVSAASKQADKMYGDMGIKLVQHAKRTQNLAHLPPYQAELVRAVTREVRDLDKDVKDLLEPFQGSFDPAADQAVACTLLVNHLSMRRNKRCLLAYHRTRTDKLEELVWDGSDVVDLSGQQVRDSASATNSAAAQAGDAAATSSLSPQEEDYVRQYSDLLAAYKGQWTDIDLTGSLEPPRDLFIDVRVLKDAGEIQTEYGAITLTKNSQFYVRQGDVERLIAQGYLQKLS